MVIIIGPGVYLCATLLYPCLGDGLIGLGAVEGGGVRSHP